MSGQGDDWRPTATQSMLRRRAELYGALRAYFADQGVMEVDTPMLSCFGTVDRYLDSLATTDGQWLQTSPEFAMKRLLAAGSGPIYQLVHAVRPGETGRLHNPEFTMLEWYRPEWDHLRLMEDVEQLLQRLGAPRQPFPRLSFREAFEQAGLPDPLVAPTGDLAAAALAHDLDVQGLDASAAAAHDDWLAVLLNEVVLRGRKGHGPWFLHDFPASQAALARIRDDAPPVAERFELIWGDVELANGFHELTDADEQARRFADDRRWRLERGLPTPPIDTRLVAALESGVPVCAGVALGVDRLLMMLSGAGHIDDVLSFPSARA